MSCECCKPKVVDMCPACGGEMWFPPQCISRNQLRLAVNESCTCGGKGVGDEGACPACLVWHQINPRG